ncbi:Gfo/Idh/MocA family oxidoreductase [Pseudogracilibacillus sp. SE30717A]|uniref:Gfo/Idh/MocA family protein n=1 Tax=Pseudogracilibacillus sp. SE30717A TaxID=3098293 RepID=UPI00300E16E1
MKKVRWGILSTARIAVDQLIPAIKKVENAEIAAIATRSDIDRATAIAKQFQINKVYSSYEDLLNDSTIDVVYIPLPNHLHKEWTIKAAQKGKHILCEKPAALNGEEVEEMKQVCLENNVLFMEAFMYYFHPQHERVTEIINSGEIGDVSFMEAGFSFYLEDKERDKDIRMNSNTGGGTIYDLGCYTIHAIRNILRQEPESVYVHGNIDSTFNVETDAVAYLTFKNNLRATFNISFNRPMHHEYRVFGTEGTITVP